MNTQDKLRKDLQSIVEKITAEQVIFEMKRDGVIGGSRSTINSFLRGIRISEKTEKSIAQWIEKRKG